MNKYKAERWMSMDLDGELPPRRRIRLERWLERHPDLIAHRSAWRNLGETMRNQAGSLPVDAAQDWINIRRRIRTEGDRVADAPRGVPRYAPAWALASLAVLAGLASWGLFFRSGDEALMAQASQVEQVETHLPGSSFLVFEADESGIAVVWVIADESEQTNES